MNKKCPKKCAQTNIKLPTKNLEALLEKMEIRMHFTPKLPLRFPYGSLKRQNYFASYLRRILQVVKQLYYTILQLELSIITKIAFSNT